jgi:hypothetical protein
VFPAAPEESLVLLKPTATVEHGGSQRFEIGSETYNTLVRWIRGGMIYRHTNEPALAGLSIEPRERSYKKGATQQLRVQAQYSDGSKRDVTALADFVSNEKEIATGGRARPGASRKSERARCRGGSLHGLRRCGAHHLAGGSNASSQTLRHAASEQFHRRTRIHTFPQAGLVPSEGCADAEFLRRSTLDTIGVLPTVDEARAFLANTSPDKRRTWIDHLLAHPAFGDHWANKWADLLRPNPDRVGVKSVFLLDQWLRESFRSGKPYDQFVREILLAEGSNHRDGPDCRVSRSPRSARTDDDVQSTFPRRADGMREVPSPPK